MRRRALFILLLVLACSPRRGAFAAEPMRQFETRYYLLNTDVDLLQARAAAVRIDRMAEEYYARTRDFSGVIREKFPFFLYRNEQEYFDSGGPRNSDGLFDGRQLKVIAGETLNDRTWHVVQHEGFHQFAHSVIGGRLPPWVDEGMADYFGEAIYTGDGLVSGVIPQWRLARVRKLMKTDRFVTADTMMHMKLSEWNADLDVDHYDQAWSMIQFLAHGDNGRYQQPFGQYMWQLAHGIDQDQAWRSTFGDVGAFELKWREYWLKLKDDPTSALFARANVLTVTSFLSRAFEQKQTFRSFDEFANAATTTQLRCSDDKWLPPSLAQDAVRSSNELIKQGGSIELVRPSDRGGLPMVVATLPDGTRIVGSFKLRDGAAGGVTAMTVPRKAQ